MKLTCERCRAQYDIADAKIPASGFQMTCPACSHVMKVTPAGAAPPAPPPRSGAREIALSSLGDDDVSVETPLPPPVSTAPVTQDGPALELADMDFAELSGTPPPVVEEVADLPTPAGSAKQSSIMAPPARQPEVVDLPAPRGAPPTRPIADAGAPDLPAPKMLRPPGVGGVVDLPAPRTGPPPVADLPAPKVGGKSGPPDLPRPKTPASRPPVPTAAKPPVASPPKPPIAPTPIAASPPRVAAPPADDVGIPLDLDAPDVDDLPQVSSVDLPRPQTDGGLDVVAPRASAGVDVDASADIVAPKTDEGTDVLAPRMPDAEPENLADALEPPPSKPAASRAARAARADAEDEPRNRRPLMFAIGGVAVVAALGGGAFALGIFGDRGAAQREIAAKAVAAHKAIVADLPSPLRKAVSDLKPYAEAEKPNAEAAAVEAEVHLSLARLGVAGELTAAKTLLEVPAVGAPGVDHARGDALRAAMSGDVAPARHTLNEIIAADPKDALALADLGWTELAAHDLEAAQKAFTRAVAVDPSGALYNYGLGLVAERRGDEKTAKDAYGKTLAVAPEHARARIGLLRIDAHGGDAAAAAKLEAFQDEHAATLQPRERAELMVALGQVALANGRWDEGEERFKRALAIEPDATTSPVAYDAKLGLSRARVEAGHGGDVIEDLKKLLVADARGVEVRLLLARALIDKQQVKDAEPLLAAAEKIDAKDPRLALLRARVLLAGPTPSSQDREQAMEQLKAAVAADPHLVTAWADLAKLENDLGRSSDAVATLGKAADVLAGDARGAAAIGAAYLAIGRPADAEARFRAVLAADAGKPPVPEHLPIALGLGEALEAQGKLDAAAQAYADAQTLAPKSALLAERRAHLAERMHKPDEARAAYDEALKLAPPTVALRLAAATLALQQGRVSDARPLVESAVKDDDRSVAGYVLLARVEVASGHPDEAVGLARRAAILGESPEAHLVLANVLESNGKIDDALAEYKLAQKAPVLEAATLGHARMLVRSGATKDALVELEPLSKAGAVRGEALALMGDSYSDLQQQDKALRSYEEAVRLAPQAADLAFKLGRALIDASKREPGIAALERAIKLADAKAPWLPDAYLLLGDGHRGHENDLAIRSYTKYLEIAPASAPMRAEAAKQISLLGGTPPTP